MLSDLSSVLHNGSRILVSEAEESIATIAASIIHNLMLVGRAAVERVAMFFFNQLRKANPSLAAWSKIHGHAAISKSVNDVYTHANKAALEFKMLLQASAKMVAVRTRLSESCDELFNVLAASQKDVVSWLQLCASCQGSEIDYELLMHLIVERGEQFFKSEMLFMTPAQNKVMVSFGAAIAKASAEYAAKQYQQDCMLFRQSSTEKSSTLAGWDWTYALPCLVHTASTMASSASEMSNPYQEESDRGVHELFVSVTKFSRDEKRAYNLIDMSKVLGRLPDASAFSMVLAVEDLRCSAAHSLVCRFGKPGAVPQNAIQIFSVDAR